MKQIVRLTEQDLHKIIKESAKRLITEVDHHDEVFQDAIDALEMSDGAIDYYEWSPAWMGDDENELVGIWNDACEQTGFPEMREEL